MISIHQIERLIELGSDRQLAARILANGRCDCPHLRELLLARDRVRVVALGLALQRACELSYHPGTNRFVSEIAERLLAAQGPAGLFGGQGDPVASAVALGGLLHWRTLCAECGAEVDRRIDAAIERGLDAITAAIEHLELHQADRVNAIVIAAVLWQLGHFAEFRSRICVDGMLHAIKPHYHHSMTEAILWRYAAAQAA